MKRIQGFVIHSDDGLFHLAAPDKQYGPNFRYGTLWFGRAATIFKSRRACRRAIARTKQYRDRYVGEKLWPWIDHAEIWPVEVAR
jgi:hypothetical protein